MFGHVGRKLNKYQAATAKKQQAAEKKAQIKQRKVDDESEKKFNNQVVEKSAQSKNMRQQARQEGRTYAEGVLKRDVQGLNPQQKQAMQYEANQRIHRDLQQQERKLLGEQGRRGIGGKSGVAFAQQQELQRGAQELQGQVHRDVNKLDSDVALKKLAAMFNIEQGEASQAQLDRQMAIDELELSQEKKRQRAIEDKMNSLFSRL